eukprot:6031940-Prorocentrum_lima.AAC.1
MLKIQQYFETWHGMSRRNEEIVRQHPTRTRSINRHKIPRNSRDHQQKRSERKLWRLTNKQRI